jgi:hypothetical protein
VLAIKKPGCDDTAPPEAQNQQQAETPPPAEQSPQQAVKAARQRAALEASGSGAALMLLPLDEEEGVLDAACQRAHDRAAKLQAAYQQCSRSSELPVRRSPFANHVNSLSEPEVERGAKSEGDQVERVRRAARGGGGRGCWGAGRGRPVLVCGDLPRPGGSLKQRAAGGN